jgi:VIT1/CCC1 family predicted Fe2+/Mn2+ transporter
MKLLTIILGFTFVIKTMQKKERFSSSSYDILRQELPEAAFMLDDERRHENELYGMLDEERLHYIGAMVLGLNDALVELTGAIAGVTFALADTRLVAMTGIITGVSATLSMAASNYLAERAQGNKNALKSSTYTGVAYLLTVALLVLPYLLFPSHMYVAAFAVMLGIVLLIILVFNYYLSVAKEEAFLRRFGEMAVISLSVAVISFVIGILAKQLLGIDTL